MQSPVVYNVVDEYTVAQSGDLANKTNDGEVSTSPGWCLAVIRLSKPLTYSRKAKGSVGPAVFGAFQRRDAPLIIFDDCVQLQITRNLKTHTKNLSALLKSASNNYLSANVILPGDWIFAWCHNSIDDTRAVIKKVLTGEAANDFSSGLKFVGRVHDIRKRTFVSKQARTLSYTLTAVGFDELDASFYYDVHLATAAFGGGNTQIAKFMAQIGLNWVDFASGQIETAGVIKDNMGALIPALIDSVIGKGGRAKVVNKPIDNMYETSNVSNAGIEKGKIVEGGAKIVLTAGDEEAPYAYMIPVAAAGILGKTILDKSKPQVFGYSDILNLLIGVQKYDSSMANTPSKGFWPILASNSYGNRFFCEEHLKGTYLVTQQATFINRPVWQILQQFLNAAINQMYTALRVGPSGAIMPTLVARQIPFSTQSIEEDPDFKLTRFLEIPRWKIDPVMVKDFDVGRSEASHFNMVKLSGDFTPFSKTELTNASKNELRNPPVFDNTDIGRSGVRPYMQVVNCSIADATRPDGIRTWTTAVADWTIGSQYTLNGTMTCSGIQTPIAEGDNIEFEGIVYHIESITDSCQITKTGKSFNTTLSLSMGMPIDQTTDNGSISTDFPRYPGFTIIGVDKSEKPNDAELASAASHESLDGVLPDSMFSDLGKESFSHSQTVTDEAAGNDAELTTVDPGMSEER